LQLACLHFRGDRFVGIEPNAALALSFAQAAKVYFDDSTDRDDPGAVLREELNDLLPDLEAFAQRQRARTR